MPEHLLDSIVSGVVTNEELDTEPYGFRVGWIRWFSGFRDTDLRISDLVIGLDGVAYDREKRKEFRHKAFGSYSEDQHWAQVGARDGRRVVVTVLRGRERLDIEGRVLAERSWLNDDNRRTIGPGGPDPLSNDGFDSSWATWLERQVEDFGSRVLERGWRRGTVPNSRQMLAQHLAEKPRVDYLVERFPGPFAAQTARDWEAVREALVGRRYEIRDEELAWRTRGDRSVADIAAEAKTAREAFLASVTAEQIEPFPAIDPIRGDRASVAGKIVALPVLENRDWTMDGGRAWLVAGSPQDGWYFVDTQSPGMRSAFDAMWRYQKKVAPNIRETHQVIGRIGPNPKMLVKAGAAITGLLVEPLANTIGDAVFVDLRTEQAPFAGETRLGEVGELALDDAAPPEKVMEMFVLALKLGNEEFWRGLFATWEASRADGRASYRTDWGAAVSDNLSSEWIHARRLLEEAVCDVRVAAVDEIQVVVRPDDFPGAPTIEQTTVEVDHVGLFDGEYHAFKDVSVHRLFPMQRRDGGPWRITEPVGI